MVYVWIFTVIIAICVWKIFQWCLTDAHHDIVPENSGDDKEEEKQTPKSTSGSVQRDVTNIPKSENSGGDKEEEKQTPKSTSGSVQRDVTNIPKSETSGGDKEEERQTPKSTSGSVQRDVTHRPKSEKNIVFAFNSELLEQLGQVGLDASYWAEILQTKLDITCSQQIQYLDETDLEELKGSLRHQWEAKALKKLIGIRNEPTSSQGVNEDKIEIVANLNEVGLIMSALTSQDRQSHRGQSEPCVSVVQVQQEVDNQEPQRLPVEPCKPVVMEQQEPDRQEPQQGQIKLYETVVSQQQNAADRQESKREPIGSDELAVTAYQKTERQEPQKGPLDPFRFVDPAKQQVDITKQQRGSVDSCEPIVQSQHEKDSQQQRGPIELCKTEIPAQHEIDRQELQLGPVKPGESVAPAQRATEKQQPLHRPIEPCKPVLPTIHQADRQKPQEKTSEPCEHIIPVRVAFSEILTVLGLNGYYPSKISILDVIIIKKTDEHPKLVDIPWIILRKLLMIDFHARDGVWALLKESDKRPDGDDDFNLDYFLLEDQTISGTDDAANLNTLDVLVAIFACCDNMLKQIIAEKLFICKLAIPFLYPLKAESVVMSLWALRTITVQRHTEQKEITETQVTEKPFPTVTFVRLGRPPLSKSKLMNDILRDNSHDTFFHYDCNNGTTPRRLTDGLVECSWFVSAGKEKEHLPCTTMFLNLRGDASLIEKQMQVLQEISSVVFVIVTAQDLVKPANTKAFKQIYDSGVKIILFLISGNNKQERQACVEALGKDILKSVSIIHSMQHRSQKNASDLQTEARKQLSEAISRSSGIVLNECAQLAAKMGIIIDECDDFACLEGRDLARKVFSHMEGKEIVDCKSILLPLQGAEWLEYCNLKKKQHRASAKGTGSSSAYEAANMKQKMDDLRRKQAKMGDNGLTPFVKDFMSTLQKNQDVVLYFLMWMNILLDEKSRDNLPGLRKRYHTLWGKFQEAKKKQKTADMNEMKKQVDDAEKQLASASLGLENLFRELGQLYEAYKESRTLGKDAAIVEYLPEIAAKLLTKGIPLELIDGDASSVPISWVKSVLKNLKTIIGEKRVFVLSVLGIQSSGKSTLLNTMFGLKFAVSAGRCTRGAYMQLIPVDDSAKLPFDYIIVVDTEGLRAPELGQQKLEHDNELATLVIGLGDVTIVNIKGENTAEVKDTLQIAVHAFLRMNLVSKHMEDRRSCIFVHQNVSAANAEVLMMQGCQKLQEDLDDMAKEAALSENIANINSFSQIINFDVQNHVWYISDLWNGDPPMAPANPGYIEKISAVKQSLLRDIIKEKTTFLTASDLSLHLEDLWNGVLADDFVFSFRNSLEMKAYNGLQSEYFKLEWELQKSLKSWLEKAQIKLKMTETIDELDHSFRSLTANLSEVLAKKAMEIKSCLDIYFEKNNLKDIIIQWQQSILLQLDIAVQQHQNEGKSALLSIKDSCLVEIMQTRKWTEHEAHIMKKAVELAKEFKGKEMTGLELQKQFDSMWKPMVDELSLKSSEKEQKIELMIEEILFAKFDSQGSVLRDELTRLPLLNPPRHAFLEGSITLEDITQRDHISLKDTKQGVTLMDRLKRKMGYTKDLEEQAKHKTVALTEIILREVRDELKKLSSHDTKFLRSHAIEIIQKLVDRLDAYNRDAMLSDKCTFTIRKSYYVKLAVHVSRYCVRDFSSIQREYTKKHGIKANLEVYKNKAWSLFKNLVKQSAEEVIAGDLLCTQLKEVIYEAVKAKIPPQCVEEVLRDFQMTKYYLIVNIMDDLACKDNFKDYASYIQNSKEFALSWVAQYTHEKILLSENERSLSRYAEIAKIHIARIIRCVVDSVQHATSEAQGQGHERMTVWIDNFCQRVSEEIAVPISTLNVMGARKVGDFNNLQNIILDELDNNVKAFLDDAFVYEIEDSIDWDGKPLSHQILDKIWGCPEQCPFCKEPCADNKEGHYSLSGKDHMCVQHRPQAVGGYRSTKTHQLCVENCMYLVQCKNDTFRCRSCTNKLQDNENGSYDDSNIVCHKYIEYKTCKKDWDIAPDSTNSVSKYWMWFMATYKHELKDLYRCKLPNIPESWNSITKQEALDDLRKYHN